MAKYSIEDTTLTNIANAIRGKTGSSDSIRVDNMATKINSIQTGSSSENLDAVIAEQAELIAELETALEGKASGGSGGGSMETCTVTIEAVGFRATSKEVHICSTTINNNKEFTVYSETIMDDTITVSNIIKGSAIVVIDIAGTIAGASITSEIVEIENSFPYFTFQANGDGGITFD